MTTCSPTCWSRRSRSTACAVSTSYALHPQVGLREERFGALAYHYGNRRLTFLNDARLVSIVRSIDPYDDVEVALAAADIPVAPRQATRHALSTIHTTAVND